MIIISICLFYWIVSSFVVDKENGSQANMINMGLSI